MNINMELLGDTGVWERGRRAGDRRNMIEIHYVYENSITKSTKNC
jgi:hypothetical protein